jgi:hypothetical protein
MLDMKCILLFPLRYVAGGENKEAVMSAFAVAFALFLGFAGWGMGFMQLGSIVAGGGDEGTVKAMEDPLPPPRP